jgi:tRNA/tmRNA/rRNA uracil-C5-methylase (TrmA/RlmC/RlmD family)
MRFKIEKLVYGGAGLARSDEGVVFIPRTAPGDVVEAEIIERKKDYATAALKQILEPSPDRQTPYCPNYETAGCCHWQHIDYKRQVQHKDAIIRESLGRLGHFQWAGEIKHVTGPDRNYRMRATFHVANGQLGFIREKTHTVIPIRGCASLVPELNQFIGSVDATGAREVHALSAPEVVSSFVLNNGTIQRAGHATVHVDGLQYRVTADTFFQANRFLLAPFINEVVEQAAPDSKNILELYAGAGFFSIPLARLARELIAIESNRTAVRQARENAAANKTHLRVVEGEADVAMQSSELKPDVIVLDPPRAGCGVKATERIAGLNAARIVYISCNPSTFAREAAILLQQNYQLQRVTLIDQFPNTYHIELVASFELK